MLTEVQDLAARMMEAQKSKRVADRSAIYHPTSTTASSLGYKCERRLVYGRTQPEMAAPFGAELLSIFAEGDLHQSDVRKELIELGFEALEAERPFRDEKLEISGRIDGMISVANDHRTRIPVEIKSSAGNPPDTAEGLRDHDGLYGRYWAQLQVYLFLTATEYGMFLFKDKIVGLWTIVVVPLDYEGAEALLKKAERVRDNIKAGTLPNRLADRSECVGCSFKDTICHPEQEVVDPLLIAEDAELYDQLKERETLDPARKRYKKLDDTVKDRFKMTKFSSLVVGDEHGFLVTKKETAKSVRLTIKRLDSSR